MGRIGPMLIIVALTMYICLSLSHYLVNSFVVVLMKITTLTLKFCFLYFLFSTVM